jgi:hypothetical protein
VTDRFDYRALIDELRCRPTEWLLDRRALAVREQRRWRVEELALLAVLDERGKVDGTTAAGDGVSERTMRDTVETARKLEELPEVAAAAHAGEISDEQLAPLSRLADPDSDAQWAHRGAHTAPADLERLARTKTKPTADDARKRRDARTFRMWWSKDHGMLNVRGELPDIDGALVETTINDLVDKMRPAKGQPWATRDQRAADALVSVCRRDQTDTDQPKAAARTPLFVVQVPLHGPAEICGIPLPDTIVEQLRASVNIEPTLVDHHGVPLARGRIFSALSPKITRAVVLRDGHCRCGTCDRRHGLQIHHLWPRSWGGTDDLANLTAVCVGGSTDHHPTLVPHGPWLLLGNPNQPDGLRLVHRDQIPNLDHYIRRRRPPTLQELGLDQPHPHTRAGPDAA